MNKLYIISFLFLILSSISFSQIERIKNDIKINSGPEISDAVLGNIVARGVKLNPDKISSLVKSAVIASGGCEANHNRIITVMSIALSAHPTPFSAIVEVRDSVLQVIRDSPILVNQINNGAIAIAEYTHDNPLAVISVEEVAESTPVSKSGSSVTTNAGGTRILPIDAIPLTMEPLLLASPVDGRR